MLVSEDDFVKIARNGDFVVTKVVQPGSAAIGGVRQGRNDFSGWHAYFVCLGVICGEYRCGITLFFGSTIDT
jgi:hypothetical protein